MRRAFAAVVSLADVASVRSPTQQSIVMAGVRQPSGSVTMVFTDIEGSTKLLEELGTAGYREALAEHRRIVRDACASYEGYEVDYEGDAFFYAFPSAGDAVAAVTEAMAGLAEGPIRIRVGIHTGDPELDPPKYVGIDVHTAARIMASGHGGQVVVSPTTAALIDAPLHELGEHRLKDIAEPIPLYQLGDGDFPPLKTISNTNLPRPASYFVGRERELEEVLARIEEGARLLTLTGPGGSGKTRLALEAASALVPEYKAGVFWIGLTALRDPALVSETIGQTLGAKDGLADHIAEREMLLLLDNLEQVIDAAPELSALVQACSNLTLLVTSRELLRVQGEVEYAVPPLSEPEAVELFCRRSELEADETIAELCHRLDDLPLAVELAAARTKALSPAQIIERLSQRLDLLRGGRDAEARQQTLRATIAWSYELLTPEEQRLFARLSVFAGGCTLEAAEEVADADLGRLQSLVEKSLLRFSDERYWMLETIREYAGDNLEKSGEANQQRPRHAAHYACLAAALAQPLRQYSAEALATVTDEIDNMRAALAFALNRDDVAMASDLISGLWFYWLTSGRGVEASAWAQRYVALPRQLVEPLDRFDGDGGAAEIFRFTGEFARARELTQELVATGRANPKAIVHGLVIERPLAATLSDLAYMDLEVGDFDEARSHAEEALAIRRDLGLPHGIAHALLAVAAVEYNTRDFARASELYAEAGSIYEAAGSHGDAVYASFELAECELLLGRLDEAERTLHRALIAVQEITDQTHEITGLRVAGMLAAAKGYAERAVLLLGAADARLRETGLALFGTLEAELQRSHLEHAKRDLSGARFQATLARGAAMTLAEAIAYALEEPSRRAPASPRKL
jgi:predicted ATPase/class 3 adenylate cyclase